MFIKGDYSLKFGLRHDESPREALKFAMLKQEDTFRKQVLQHLTAYFCKITPWGLKLYII